MSKRPDSLKSLAKAMPLICRATVETTRTLRATSGEEITPELRDELLVKCQAGGYVEVDIDITAYEQRPGVANRNFVRFRDGAMLRFGSSGKSTPFLRNHDQQDVMARGGTTLQSKTEKLGDGEYIIRQTTRLTAPWAVEMALRELLDRVSIGWHGDDVECSVCGTPVYTECYHWPGDRVNEVTGEDGKKRYVRDRNGALRVEWIFNDPVLTETSAVNVPAVERAGIDAVRAALSAFLPDDADGDGVTPRECEPDARASSARPHPSAEPKEPEMPEPIVIDTTTAEFKAAVAAEAAKQTASRLGNAKAARQVATSLAMDPDDVERRALAAEDFGAFRLSLLDEVTSRQAASGAAAIRAEHVEVGVEASDKKRSLIEKALLCKMSGSKSEDKDVERYSRRSLLSIGDELFRDAGISERDLRDIDPADRAKLMLGMRLPIGVQRKLAGPGMNSTSDFPLIIGSVLNTRMRALYALRQQLWKAFALKENLKDFTAVPTYIGGRFPRLLPVEQGGTYQRGSFQMSSMEVQLGKAGRIVSLTWELLLADRIGLIERVVSDRVNSALRWEDALFYARVLANLMADGTTAIWDTPNTATAGAVGITPLTSAFVKMATRSAEPGDPVVGPGEGTDVVLVANAKPRFWHTPAVSEVAATSLLSDDWTPTTPVKPTPAMKRLEVIGDGTLDANSHTTSYLYADPNEAPVWTYGHLASEDGPALEEEDGFTVDGKDYKVRHTAYVEAVDNVGTVRLPLS